MADQNTKIRQALDSGDGLLAFELMHGELDKVWDEVYRVLRQGGIACINIGDATRTINGNFSLYSNHSRILNYLLKLGFSNLPNIIWRKQTNAPNKFMGSGMLPPGAYVTLEHEYILIFRKGAKRVFKGDEERKNRQSSSFFWEERNIWFSDVWDFKGTSQKLNDKQTRDRSGAYPFELAYRLINMFSLKGDMVLDPFLGTGTTTVAAVTSARNSIGYELDQHFSNVIFTNFAEPLGVAEELNKVNRSRLANHLSFVVKRKEGKQFKPLKHRNKHYNFEVMTSQETNIVLNYIKAIRLDKDLIVAEYFTEPMLDCYLKNSLFSST